MYLSFFFFSFDTSVTSCRHSAIISSSPRSSSCSKMSGNNPISTSCIKRLWNSNHKTSLIEYGKKTLWSIKCRHRNLTRKKDSCRRYNKMMRRPLRGLNRRLFSKARELEHLRSICDRKSFRTSTCVRLHRSRQGLSSELPRISCLAVTNRSHG